MSGPIDLGELLSACVDLGVRAGHEIRRIVESGGDLAIKNKGDETEFDPQTIADLTAEKMIAGSLRKAWPGIAIVGEEGTTETEEKFLVVPSRTLLTNQLEHPNKPRINWETANYGNVVVFIDPLDGTKEFTEGIHSAVTVLIGIALEGRPIAGVICQPWFSEEQRCVWASRFDGPYACTYPQSATTVPEDGSCWESLKVKRNGHDSMVVGTSRSHGRPEIDSAIQNSKATEVKRSGGAGNKILQLIEGEIDCYLYPVKGTKRWDTCAGEAVLLSVGGMLTDKNGELYNYTNSADPEIVANTLGLVAAVDPTKHKTFVAACQ